MNTNNSLSLMQAIATFSLIFSLGLAYVINPIDDSLFFNALSNIVSEIYGEDVLSKLNNSAVAGMIVGLFSGTFFIFLSINKKIYDYTMLFIFLFVILVFVADIRDYDSFPYQAVSYTHLTLPTKRIV